MRLPAPTATEVRWWFYVVAVCTLALTTTIVWGIVHKVSQSDGVLHVAVANADQVQRLSEQLDAQAADRAKVTADLKRQLKAVRADLRAQRSAQRALLAYLQSHGITVPPSAFAPTTGGSGPKGPAPSGAHPTQPSPSTGSHTPSPTPRPTVTPSPGTGVTDPLCALLPFDPCPLP